MAATYNKTAYADLKTGDVVIITEQKGDNVYAASNDQGTSKAPIATAVTVANDAITTDATNILWTVEKDGNNISFQAGEDYLYCTSTNNGVRVGAGASNVFSIDATSGYLYNNGTSRYIGVYNGADWRCYTSVNSNITGQTLAFYVLAAEQGGEDPQPTTRTIYLNGGGSSLWNQADAVFFAHAWGGTGVDVIMAQVEGDVYSASIPADNANLCFVRMAPGSEAINWDTKWNQSTDQTIPADKNLFTMTDWSNGTWSVYGDTPETPAPVEAAYYLVGSMNNWQTAEAYKFAAAETEGEYLLHTTLAVDDEIKVIKVEGETTTWYPAQGGNYVVDAAHAGEKDIYFRPAGNEAWVDFGGYIWMGENQPAPVADFTQPFTLKFNGTGKSDSDASGAFAADVAAIFDAASAPYVASVETATKIYAGRPIADDNSSVKFGTSSAQGAFAFTLAQAIEVDSIIVNATQYGNDAAEVTINGIKFDLTQGNKVPTDCKLVPNGAISEITIAQTGSQRIYLRNIRVYPKNQGGDTPEEIVLPVVKLAGSLTSWEEPVLMANAEDSLSASVTLNLGIDQYQLKVVSDGNWLSRAGEGDLYTMHRDWNHVDHLDLINTGDNIKLITDVEGEYTFTWTYADSSLVVTFPEAPAQPKFYITGNEDIVGEGKATWGKTDALESFSDTLVMNLAAGFHKFKLITPAEQWLGMEALTDTVYGLSTDGDTNICFNLAEAGAVTVVYNDSVFTVNGNFYVAPVAKYYLIGDSAFVVDAGATADKAWTPDAIASFKDTTVLNLKAGVDYIMRLSLEGTWENHRDFRHLTDTAAGLIELPDEYGNHSIGFSLAEAGEVTVIYIPAAEEQPEVFKLIGNFYVAPAPDPTVSVYGEMTDPAWKVEVPFTLSDDKTYASLTVENIGADEYAFKFVINGEWRSNGYRYHRDFPGAAGISGDNDANMVFVADQDGAYTFAWYFANDSLAITYPEYIEPAKYYITGDSALVDSLAWNPRAIKAEQDTMVLNLAAGDYKMKITLNGEWETGRGYSSLTDKTEGLSADDDDNIVFTLAEAGAVTVVYNDSVYTVSGNFYVEPIIPIVMKDLALVPGVWATDSAVLAAWTWGAEAAGAWSAFAGEGDTLIAKINEKADSVIFVRFEAKAEMDWNSTIWNRTADMKLDSCGIFFVNGWDEYSWCEAPAPVIPAKYYITGDSALVGAELMWHPDAIKVMEDEYIFENLAAGDYKLKVTVDGDWATGKGYSDLTVKAEGLSTDNDNNVIFTLAEAGNVTVVYNDSVFTVSGNFYVVPAPAFYITGDSALVGAELMWHPDAIKVMEDAYIFENLAAGDYKLKVTVDGDWATGKGYSDLTVKAEGLSTDNDNNIIFTLAEAGNVTVVYNDSVFTLDGDFYVEPVTVEYYAKYAGENGEWNWHALNEAEGLWLTDTIVYYGGGMNINTAADDAEALYIAEIEGVAANDTAFFAFNPADSTLAVTVVGAYVVPEVPELEDGFYLVGSMNAWTPAAEYKLAANTESEGEYFIAMTFAENDAFKVVAVANDAITTWYPDNAGDYIVDINHAGKTTVYFRPDYQGAEGWHAGCIYVVPTGTVDIDNTNADVKATKLIINGQLFIEKAGKRYNAQGVLVR